MIYNRSGSLSAKERAEILSRESIGWLMISVLNLIHVKNIEGKNG